MVDWKPIKSAPKNGETILVWHEGIEPSGVFWSKQNKEWVWASSWQTEQLPFSGKPTHWLPMPDYPSK